MRRCARAKNDSCGSPETADAARPAAPRLKAGGIPTPFGTLVPPRAHLRVRIPAKIALPLEWQGYRQAPTGLGARQHGPRRSPELEASWAVQPEPVRAHRLR